MSVNEELDAAGSDSFWEVDQFRRTVKRVEDGLHMSHELTRLISERSEIEREYAKKLQMWSKKWTDTIEKGPEYGTNKAILLGSLNEADALADVHNIIRDKLLEVRDDVKKWRHETYKKQMVGGCKEAKMFEDEFRKAQKPWAKKLAKVQKCRKDYHSACKLEKATSAQLSAEANSDQTKKLQDRLDKSKKDVESTKDKYEEALAVLHKYNATYVDDMTDVFDKTQTFEEKRLRYFKEVLIGIHQSLDISKSLDIPRIYEQLKMTIHMSDANKDLKWWSQNHGVEMPMLWPTFEEYSTEPATISRKEKTRTMFVASSDTSLQNVTSSVEKNGAVPRVPPTAVSKEPAGSSREVAAVTRAAVSQPAPVLRQGSYDTRLNPFADDDESDENADMDDRCPSAASSSGPSVDSVPSAPLGVSSTPARSSPALSGSARASPALSRSGISEAATASVINSSSPEVVAVTRPERTVVAPKKTSSDDAVALGSNPFDDDDDDDEGEDYSNATGVPVEALFNYTAQEGDELSFKLGDRLEKLRDKDDQGWCLGRINGRIGLYPDNYVKLSKE